MGSESNLSTQVTEQDLADAVRDWYGVLYSSDGMRLLKCQNKHLTEYTVRSKTKVICDVAFLGCDSLTQVAIGNSVTKIGKSAFQRCPKLAGKLIIPNSVTSIGRYAFNGCSGLTQLTIGNNVTSIGYGAFKGCSGLTEVSIPNSVTTICKYSFYKCTELSHVTLEDGKAILSMAPDAFKNCPVETLYVGRVLCVYSKFENKTTLTSITIREGVTAISSEAFRGCTGLTTINIPDSVNTIGERAFYGCSGLTQVSIGNSVTKIGREAFYKCARLATINIPDSVNTIGERAFYGCTGLTNLEVLENNEYYCAVDGVLFTKDMTTLVQFPAASSTTSYRIPESVTTIRSYAFYNCSGLTEVTIGESVTMMGESAFQGCTGLKTVNFDAIACTATGPYSCAEVFGGCSNISKVNIGYNVTIIPEGLCSRLKGLTQVIIPEGVTSIGDDAFASCSGLTNVTIPHSVTTIGNGAFFFCESLKRIEIPDFVISIGDFSFMSCRNLVDVTLGSSLKYVGIKSFVDGPALRIIRSHNSEPPMCSGNITFDPCMLYVPKDSKAAYANSKGWNRILYIREI